MTGLWGRRFWIEAADRAVKSAVQALLLLWGDSVTFNVLGIDPKAAAGVALSAAVLSALTSIVSAPAGRKGTATALQ